MWNRLTSPFSAPGLLLGIGVFLAAMALVAAVFQIARGERAFELHRWEKWLRGASARPLESANAWLGESRNGLRAVAVNPTVQIYLSETAAANYSPQAVPNAEAQLAFLSSYVANLGSRGAFATPPGNASSDIGLAVLDGRRHVVASTRGFRPTPQLAARLIGSLKNGGTAPLLMGPGLVAFADVIRPIQGGGAAVGYVVGERRLSDSLWSSSGSALSDDGGHETLVAVGAAAEVQLIGSSLSGAPRRFSSSVAEVGAARTPLVLVQGRDLAGEDALALGVPVKNTNWILVESVPSAAALAGVDARIRNLVVILLLTLLAIILGVLALWRHLSASEQIARREANLQLYRGAADLLLQAIDARDHGAAEHSHRVADLSRKMALRLGASQIDADTAELSGALMNVGKLFVPVELLTKRGTLAQAEASLFSRGTERWLDLLAHTPFGQTIEPVLRDAHRLGKEGLSETSGIAPMAYIITVANIAVALMSVRAYRLAHSPDETIAIIANSGIPVPPHVVEALRDAISEEK